MTGYIRIPKGKLYYETVGEGETIVFIHGFSLDRRMWAPQVAEFSKNYQVVTYDARGFGRSSLPEGTYQHHADLRHLLTGLGISQAHLVGLSMGGRIAANFTVMYPQMVKSLTLLDAALNGYPNSVNWDVGLAGRGMAVAKANWLNHELFHDTKLHLDAARACSEMVAEYSGWHWNHADPQSESDPDTANRLNEVTAPTLIIVGQGDLPQFKAIAQVYHSGIAGSKLVVIPQAGHMTNLEAPEQVNQLIAGNIKTLP